MKKTDSEHFRKVLKQTFRHSFLPLPLAVTLSLFLSVIFFCSTSLEAGSIYEKYGIEIQGGNVTCARSGEVLFSDTFSTDGVWNEKVENYLNLLKIQLRSEFQGFSCLRISGEGVPECDTAWGVETKKLELPEAMKTDGKTAGKTAEFVLAVQFCTDAQLQGEVDAGDHYRNRILWYDADGNLCGEKIFSYISDSASNTFTEARVYDTIPENAASYVIQLGFDRPNVDVGKFIVFRKVTLSRISDATPFQSEGKMVSEIISDGGNFTWEAETPGKSQLKFRISTADAGEDGTPGAWSPFHGPEGKEDVFFTKPFTAEASFVRYEATLIPDGKNAPTLKSVTVKKNSDTKIDSNWTLRGDIFPPRVKIVSETPTRKEKAPAVLEITDDTPILWNELRVSVDEKDVTENIQRDGNRVTLAPPEGAWSEGIHTVTVEISDLYGNSLTAHKFFLIGDTPSTPAVTLRDDGMTLIGGKPFFPIGIYGVMKREFNDYDLDKAFAGLKEAGFNFAHSYSSPRTDEFLAAAEKYGFKLWCVAREPDERFLTVERHSPAIIAWYLGDDTSDNTSPSELYDRDDAVKAADPTRITTQADGVHAQGIISNYEDYVRGTDSFLPEIYPVRKKDAKSAEVCVAQVICDMKRVHEDIERAGAAPRAIWPIIQYFQGWGWERFPTNQELRAMSFASLIYGANGITWYTYGGTVEPENKKFNYGVTTSPERWANISTLATQIQTLSPVLLTHTPAQPEIPEILAGPKTDALGNASVSVLLKEYDGAVYLLCVNSTTSPVTASIRLAGFTGPKTPKNAEVLFENRSIPLSDGVLTEEFQGYDVHIYKCVLTK